MRHLSIELLGCILAALLLAGCGPAVSKSELGNVVFELPKVAGADRPYKMPQLGPLQKPPTAPTTERTTRLP